MVFGSGEGSSDGFWRANHVLIPHLELAARLENCVDRLVERSTTQATKRATEHYVDLLVGLTNAAAALRGCDGDTEEVERRAQSAIEHLQRVETTGLRFPTDAVW